MTKNVKFFVAFLVFLSGVFFCLAVLFLVLFLKANGEKSSSDDDNDDDTVVTNITSFKECEAAGYPVMESYPRQCAVPGGQTYVEIIEDQDDSDQNDVDQDDAKQVSLKIYFSKEPTSSDDPTVVVAVDRQTTRTDIGTFAIEQLIAGPTSSEQVGGLYSPIKLAGTSNCSGKDFSLNVDKDAKVATLKFCKNVTSAGIGDDARIKTTIESTLNQFSTVDRVTILTKDNHCFGDQSGLDVCLNLND